MSRPDLTYVDSTILTALISAGATGDAVRRWFRHTHSAWVSSEIALTRTILHLSHKQAQPGPLDALGLLHALHAGVAIRPLPAGLLSHGSIGASRPARAAPKLALADALELETARLWHCHYLISHSEPLRQAAQSWGLISLGIGAPPAGAATVGDWPRRSPLQP